MEKRGTKRRLRLPSPAMTIACISLAIALSGASYAAVVLPRNSVGTPQLKSDAVVSSKVKNRSLKSVDFALGQLPAGPQGPMGMTGATGPAGLTGATGSQGPQGLEGPPNPNAVNAQNADKLDNLDSTAFMRAGRIGVALTQSFKGGLDHTSSFPTQAGRALITVSGTGFRVHPDDPPVGCIAVYVDGSYVRMSCLYFNVSGQHLTLPPQTMLLNVTAGMHTIRLGRGGWLGSNADDSYEITVLELP
jgi:hypothetical protein